MIAMGKSSLSPLIRTERIVVPPIFRARSAIVSVICEYLCRLLVEQQMIVAKVRPTDVPVKVLRLHVKLEHFGKQST
jgi:hypothetical protein